MRVTIIPDDGFVSIDGQHFTIDAQDLVIVGIHAVQFYGDYGEVEYNQYTIPASETAVAKIFKPANRIINDIAEFQSTLDKCIVSLPI
jgi:hypothetical protein